MSRDKPIEMLDRYSLRTATDMLVSGGKDEFNIDAQVESFLYLSGWASTSTSATTPAADTTRRRLVFHPGIVAWLAVRLEPFRGTLLIPRRAPAWEISVFVSLFRPSSFIITLSCPLGLRPNLDGGKQGTPGSQHPSG
jgi:hypothetical protein